MYIYIYIYIYTSVSLYVRRLFVFLSVPSCVCLSVYCLPACRSACLSICVCLFVDLYVCWSVYIRMSAYLSAYVRLYFCGYIRLSVYLPETYQRIEPRCRDTHRQAHMQIAIQTKMGNTPAQICSRIQHTCGQKFTYSGKCIVTPIAGNTHVCLSIKTDKQTHNQTDR